MLLVDNFAEKKVFSSMQIHFELTTQSLIKNSDYAVTLYGHTDMRGRAAYNLALGQRRANSVERFLLSQGINTNRIATVAAGEKQKINNENAIQGHALSGRVALVYATADGQEISNTSQTDDLQPER